MNKVGSAEMWLGRKWIMAVMVEREPQSQRRARDRFTLRRVHEKNKSP